jgi:hypothetical protein
MRVNTKGALISQIARCMQLPNRQITVDYYVDLDSLEVVAVHLTGHLLFTNDHQPEAVCMPGFRREGAAGSSLITRMQEHPERFARIPRIKSSVRREFMLELAEQFEEVRIPLLTGLWRLEKTSGGYDPAQYAASVPDPALRERIEMEIECFFLLKATCWLTSLPSIARESLPVAIN